MQRDAVWEVIFCSMLIAFAACSPSIVLFFGA
jgi:hypothetical protein